MDFGGHTVPEEHVVIKTNFSFIFVNLRPFLPYHLLISPLRRTDRLDKLNQEEFFDLMALLKLAISKLDSLGTSWSIILQDGVDAGQTVHHVHFHIIPRNNGDLARNNDIYEKLDVDIKRPNRSFDEMKEEADFLKTFFIERNPKL